jgi:CheY-like chemotaxis protein
MNTESQTVGRPMEVLMIEDSLTAAKLTMGALNKGQIAHHMTWVKTGEDALEFVRRSGKFARAPRPDLILLDLGLPGISGKDVLATVKDDGALQGIPVVVLTASTDPADRADVEHFDVAAYLTKPVDLEKFLWLVKELKQYWLAEVILPHIEEVETPPPDGALSSTGSLGLFKSSAPPR